jgi:glycosyltransferase involved in cell wall biosynthesis
MKITIITAVYNGESMIARTLQSVAAQDFGDVEHIIVDGGSGDATLAKIGSHSERVSAVISEPDRGVYDAFNKGLRRATGDAIAFLNCGDTYSSSRSVSLMAHALSAGVQAAFADLTIVDERDTSHVVRRYSSRHFAPSRMSYGLMPAHPTLFIRRELYQRAGEYDIQFRIAGDFEFCVRAFIREKAPYAYVPESVVIMPRGGLSNSGWRSKWEITREMKRACDANAVPTSIAKLCLRFPLKAMEMI